MREYYCYMVQQRHGEGRTLLLSRKLLHQFIIDAFAYIKQNIVAYIRANHGTFRFDFTKVHLDFIFAKESKRQLFKETVEHL